MSDFDDLAMMRERIEHCSRCSVEVAAPAVADERPGDGNGQMRLPVPGHQSTRHWTNAIKGISPPGGGEQEGEEDMERRLDDVIAALPEERRERIDARFEELKGGGRTASCAVRLGRPRRRLLCPSRSTSPLSRRSSNKPICLCRHLELPRGDRGTTRPHRRLASRAPPRIERLSDVVAPNPLPPVVLKERKVDEPAQRQRAG